MPAGAFDIDFDDIGGRGNRAGAESDATNPQLGLHVHGVDRVHAFERTPFNNVSCSTDPDFFCGLENNAHTNAQREFAVIICHRASHAQSNGGVHIMSTGVRYPRRLGAVLEASYFLYRQRINIRAESNAAFFGIRSDINHEPGFWETLSFNAVLA